jgi:ABC-2 type transport system permease protein
MSPENEGSQGTVEPAGSPSAVLPSAASPSTASPSAESIAQMPSRANINHVVPGSHAQLAQAAAPRRATTVHGGAPGYDPRRTLPLRVELRRQTGRRRTQVAIGFLFLLPLLLIAAFKLGSDNGRPDGRVTLVDLATVGAPNFALFTIFASAGFLLVVVVALFAGDTVASEASWSSLRYLLVAPVGRARLLRQKLLVALGLGGFCIVLLPVIALLSGWAAFGWAPARSPTGSTLSSGEAMARLGIIVVYLAISLLVVAALAFYAGVRTDAPLGAVGGTVMLIIICNILDQVTALGSLREILPTHYSYAWLDALGPTIQWDSMLRGTVSSFAYSAVFLALAWRHFLKKDIVS